MGWNNFQRKYNGKEQTGCLRSFQTISESSGYSFVVAFHHSVSIFHRYSPVKVTAALNDWWKFKINIHTLLLLAVTLYRHSVSEPWSFSVCRQFLMQKSSYIVAAIFYQKFRRKLEVLVDAVLTIIYLCYLKLFFWGWYDSFCWKTNDTHVVWQTACTGKG